MTRSSKGKERRDTKDLEPLKKVVSAYKYSGKGTSSLYEAIIIRGEPHFITWYESKNKFTSKPLIEEATRIIRPPSAEEQVSELTVFLGIITKVYFPKSRI